MIKFVFPLDFDDRDSAVRWVDVLGDSVDIYKIGFQLFTGEGPLFVKELVDSGKEIFLDLKLHDIPNTVRKAAQSAVRLKVKYLTAHASGGREMIKACSEALSGSETKLLAVTILTSIDENSYSECYCETGRLRDRAFKLSDIARESGADGIVCSVGEAREMRKRHGENFLIVTPGIRMCKSSDDQRRIYSPEDAKKERVDAIVMGRPVTEAKDPRIFVQKVKELLK